MIIKHRFLTRRVDRLIGPVLSGALALAVVFFLLAMPAQLMGWLLVAPPVDLATRLLVALVAAAIAGGGALALFAWLDHRGRAPAEEPEEIDFDTTEAPVSAAPRRPLFAGSDLGALAEPEPASAMILPVVDQEEEEEDALELGVALTPDVEEALRGSEDDATPIEHASLDELMRRLEAGIAARPERLAEPVAGEPRGAALRDALAELQRMAARTR